MCSLIVFPALSYFSLFLYFLWLDWLLCYSWIVTFSLFKSLFLNLFLVVPWQSWSMVCLCFGSTWSVLLRRFDRLWIKALIFGFSSSLGKIWFEMNGINHIIVVHGNRFTIRFHLCVSLWARLSLSKVALMRIFLVHLQIVFIPNWLCLQFKIITLSYGLRWVFKSDSHLISIYRPSSCW